MCVTKYENYVENTIFKSSKYDFFLFRYDCVTEKVCFVTDFFCLEMMMSIAFGSKVVLLKKN